MSLGEADSKFPGQESDARGPSPTLENPAGVFPKSSPSPAPAQYVPGTGKKSQDPRSVFSNPFALDDALAKLENALTEVISTIDDEERSVGNDEQGSLCKRFRGWRTELEMIRGTNWTPGGLQSGGRIEAPDSDARRTGAKRDPEGGMFTD